jgi:hypothetical protein
MTQKTMSIEQSLESIAIRLDELTGNAMGNSYLNVTTDYPETDLTGVENQLDEKLGDIVYTLGEIRDEISSSNINPTLELILMQLGRIADSLETKNK